MLSGVYYFAQGEWMAAGCNFVGYQPETNNSQSEGA
jgi:hypothetical protein